MVFIQHCFHIEQHCFHLDRQLSCSSKISNWLSRIPTQYSLVIQNSCSSWLSCTLSLLSNFTNTLFLTFACINFPIKYNWFSLSLCLDASAKKYFKVLMEDAGHQVFPTSSLFCISPLTTILRFSLSRLPSDWILALYISMHGVVGSPFPCCWTRKYDCCLNF